MPLLKDEIQRLAEVFAREVLQAIRRASLDDIIGGPSTRRDGRPRGRPRKSAGSVPSTTTELPSSSSSSKMGGKRASKVPLLIEAVHAATEGLSGGQLMEVLGVSRSGLAIILKKALAQGDVRQVGRHKGTRYVAG